MAVQARSAAADAAHAAAADADSDDEEGQLGCLGLGPCQGPRPLLGRGEEGKGEERGGIDGGDGESFGDISA